MYITIGDPILILGPTYDNFRLTSQSQGAIVHYFNYDNEFNLEEGEFIKTIKQLSPSLVYICNPNNPSGTLLSKAFLTKLISDYPDIIFLIDEAYFEFSGETMAEQVINFPNLFISRTFSKAFALANFRAGYLISDVNNILDQYAYAMVRNEAQVICDLSNNTDYGTQLTVDLIIKPILGTDLFVINITFTS
jgi:histidinol-phosphate aminotransferase